MRERWGGGGEKEGGGREKSDRQREERKGLKVEKDDT